MFCPKALAGIGNALPDTITDRGIPIRLSRRTRAEHVERARQRKIHEAAAPLREKLAAWLSQHEPWLTEHEPALPDELDDRAQDVCEPLLAIADLADGRWPVRARAALVALRGSGGEGDGDSSVGVRLLADIRGAFRADTDVDRISSAELLARLTHDAESPWRDWRNNRPLTAAQLGRLLHAYGIRSRSVRFGERFAKGFVREQFEDSWARYLPDVVPLPVTPSHPGASAEPGHRPPGDGSPPVTAPEAASGALPRRCDGVTDVGPAETPEEAVAASVSGVSAANAPLDAACRHSAHRGSVWTSGHGVRVCGVCHPPAHPSLVAQPSEDT